MEVLMYVRLFGLFLCLLSLTAEAGDLPPKVAAVQKYLLEQEYPEVFSDRHYRVKIEDALVADVDDDGISEVILLVKPHYRQSPTVVLFKVSKDLRVKRVVEGLAPGPLVPVSGDYLDSHTLGMAADLAVQGAAKDPKKLKQAVAIALKETGGVVEYSNFIHTDGRKGNVPVYIDMSHLKAPKDASCEKFEFSTVDALQVATKGEGSGNYIVALVGGEVYMYKIKKITADGFLQKTLMVKKVDR